MPPKKKLCRSKDQRSIIEVFRGSSDESENSSNDQTKPAPLEDTPKQPPTNKYKSMMNLHQDLCVPDIAILQTGINYDSQYTANDLLDSLSAYADNELSQKMCASPFVTILADESTDISNTKRLVIYTQIIDDGMVPSTHYVCNVECTDATGKGIAQAILSEMESRGISKDQIMSFGSDGASVMTGKHNGINSAVYIQFLTLCTMIFETVNEKKPLLHFQLLYTQSIPLLSITGSSFEMFSDVLQRHARFRLSSVPSFS